MFRIAIIVGDITRSAGTERAVVNLANMLVSYGNHEVYIFSIYSDLNGQSAFVLNNHVKVVNFNFSKSNKFKRIYSYINIICILKDIIKKFNIDIVLGTTHAFNCLLTISNISIPKIGCEHMSYDACPFYSRILRFLFYPFLTCLVLLTKEEKKKYSFVSNTKKYVIPNSLSFSIQKPACLKNLRIISVGRLTKIKGFDFLVHIAKVLSTRLPNWHIDVFGDGEERESLETMISELNVNHYISLHHVVGNIENELLTSSIFLLTSRSEGFPMVLLEAQACGLPIVTYNCSSSISELISINANGFVEPIGEIDKVVEDIIRLAQDDNIRYEFGQSAYQNSKKFSSDNIYKQWNELFQKMSVMK